MSKNPNSSPLSRAVEFRMQFEAGPGVALQRLPWHKPLEDWTRRDARFLFVRSGLSRHVVRFLRVGRDAFAVKETSEETAVREFQSYRRLRTLGVPTLLPVGTVLRHEGLAPVRTAIGVQAESQSTGFVITQLLEYSLPNYFLFQRRFQRANRKRIWDAIVRLFIELHKKHVYWGDASLSNMMVVFAKQEYPEIGLRTVLKAVLADAETVEFLPHISDKMRMADLEQFLESMAWAEEDLRRSGAVPDPVVTTDDQRYVLERYRDLFEAEREEQTFELITNIDVDKLLGTFESKEQARALLQHIFEHKWYLSERERRDVPVEEAARDWYVSVFKPVIKLFAEFEIIDDFPDSTAVSLYLDIMLHKYYLSEQRGRDVGLAAAFESYSKKIHGPREPLERMVKLVSSMRKLLER